MAYKGKYTPKNKHKYVGDANNIVYRSLWERNVFRWLDGRDDIVAWNSEEVVIPYRCATDGKMHRYFIDVWFKTSEGKAYLIEIKPKKETQPPKVPKRKTRRYLQEAMTYAKNQSKWHAAQKFAAENGVEFQVWTEDTLKHLGIKILKG
jgi:hypothetical protein